MSISRFRLSLAALMTVIFACRGFAGEEPAPKKEFTDPPPIFGPTATKQPKLRDPEGSAKFKSLTGSFITNDFGRLYEYPTQSSGLAATVLDDALSKAQKREEELQQQVQRLRKENVRRAEKDVLYVLALVIALCTAVALGIYRREKHAQTEVSMIAGLDSCLRRLPVWYGIWIGLGALLRAQ